MSIGEAKRTEKNEFLEANEMRFNIDKCKIMHLGKVIISINFKKEPAICETIIPTKPGDNNV